ITSWTGGHADALRQALRMTNESFAGHLGVAARTVAYWRKRPDMTPLPAIQEALDAALEQAPDRAKAQFALLVGQMHANANSGTDATPAHFAFPFDTMPAREGTRAEPHVLTVSFDAALEQPSTADIERLAHIWLISEPPQRIELRGGRHVSDALI